ncbi:hypothetical protein IMZ11_25805 [Microtetraspora sp. AC03309]|uniref:DUF6571 family protein n=1 Tax=Microtetraspora sp. AC03309 TaxID=2779376 RepID=UPI001E37EC78|nr:DUF6571 family protein [Microtetraspora sp. AC03309]MCC5579045.1 hypothetical protein [Microtetraspora sp. AC03309]
MPTGTGPLSPDYSGIDPDLMHGFIAALEHGRDVIGEQSERIRQLLVAAELPTAGLQPIKQIQGWIDDELPILRRRNDTIQANNALAWVPGAGLLPYNERDVRSSEESRQKGTALGKRAAELGPPGFLTGYDDNQRSIRVIDELDANKDDPDFTAAFFAALGTKGTLELPSTLRRQYQGLMTDDPIRPDERLLRILSEAFGTAVTGGSAVPGFAKIRDKVQSSSDDWDERVGAGLLLGAGKFPTGWLTGAIAARGGLTDPRKAGTGVIQALGNNPAAARIAIGKAIGPYTKDQSKLKEFIKQFNERANDDYTPADKVNAGLFGRLLAAASGAYDEQDGKHSKESAVFAYTVMTMMPDLKIGDGARVHLAEIAGAYATEITEGANIGDANMTKPSALTPTTSALGLTSAFRLSPKDTYRFLKTFADSAEHLAPFDDAMGRFSQRLIADAAAEVKRTGKVKPLDDVLTTLGNVRGFEMGAAEKVQGDLDTLDEQSKKVRQFVVNSAIGVTGLAIPGMGGQVFWLALSTGLSIVDTFGPEDEKRTDGLRKEAAIATLGRQHTLALALMANGFTPKVTPAEYQASCPPGVAIADANGDLKPFAELIKQGNAGLEAFERWATANGLGSDDELSVGGLSVLLADSFESRTGRGKERAMAYDT